MLTLKLDFCTLLIRHEIENYHYVCVYVYVYMYQGPVVQRWVSANPGLKFNLLFWFVYFYTSVYFKTSEK
jgi:hypothetical protein